MIDALGFKGIWNRAPNVLRKLEELAETTERLMDGHFGGKASFRRSLAENFGNMFDLVQASFLSDTVVYGVAMKQLHEVLTKVSEAVSDFPVPIPAPKERSPMLDSLVVVSSAVHVSETVLAAVRSEPVLAYRGAISFGEFEIARDGRFLVGPAVDDAAEHHELAQGAFVWITPRALNVLGAPAPRWPDVLVPYDVPLKGGAKLATYVVSPFAYCKTETECAEIESALLGSFSTDALDVALKRQETARFLTFARSRWTSEPPKADSTDGGAR